MAGGIIAEKKIIVRAVDEVTEPLARMNQRLAELESKLGQASSKFSSSASSQQSFKNSLNEVKASINEASTASGKLNHNISELKNKNVKIEANTSQANEKVNSFDKKIDHLKKEKPVVKPEVNSSQAEKGLERMRNSFKQTEKAGSHLKDFVGGNLIANGVSAIASNVGTWAKEGFEAAKAGAELAEKWKNLGMTNAEVKATANTVKELRENSNLSGNAVANLITRFYGFTGSAKRAQELSRGVASLTDKMKMSNEQADAFANGLTRIETSGTVSTRTLGRLEKTAPGITKALQRASGMSAKAFNQLLSSGKMTSDQFNDILAKASKDLKANADEWAKTPDGAIKQMQEKFAMAKKSIMAPLVSSSGTGLNALSKAMDKLQPQFTELGKAIANVATRFAKWLTPKHAEDLGKIVASLGRMAGVLAKGAWKAVTAPLEIIGRAINGLSGKKGDALDNVATALDHISKNKVAMNVLSGIGAVLMAQFAYSKLSKVGNGLLNIGNAIGFIGKHKLSGNLFADFAKGIKGLSKVKINPKSWFAGGKGWAKNLFKPATEEALRTGDQAGGNFITRFAAKTNASKFAELGRTTGGKLVSGIGLAFEAVDFVKDLHGALTSHNATARSRDAGKAVGAGVGAGIGFFFGGPAGAALGGMIGRVIGGKIGPTLGKFGKGTAKLLGDIFKKHDWKAVWSDIGKGWKSFWHGMGSWWDKTIGKKGSHSKKSSSSSTSSKKIKSLGGNHYSKTDIANIKEMNKAVLTYTGTLKKLKSTVKKNDPTKSLNKMNKGLKSFIKGMAKSAKPFEKLSKTFKTFGKSTKTMASSIKSLTGKHGLGEFTKDLKQLNKGMKNTKVGSYFEKLSKSIKKSKLADTMKKLDKWLGDMVKNWKQLEKPLKTATKQFTNFEKTIGKLANKKTGISKVDTDIKTLYKDLKKYNFGKTLGQQMTEANKAVGKHGFIKEFDSMMRDVERSLKSFSKDFKKYWGNTWKNLSKDARSGLNRANRTVRSELDNIDDSGSRFERGFKRSWDNWLDDLVSAFKSGFGKLPNIAGSAMRDIVSRLNKGISGINKVIGDFGGDKKLSAISYATGTSLYGRGAGYSAHPGGPAIINDGNGPYKQELVWQPSQGWKLFAGVNRMVHLEPGSQIMPAEPSHEILSAKKIPHYANGTLSDDEMDKIADEFDKNPVQASKNLILKLTDWNSSKQIIPTFGKASAIGFSRGIANVLKDLLAIVQEPINGDWGPVIRSAARKMKAHISDGFVSNLKQVIQNESGGIETRMQEIHDKNSGGNEARGLLQYTPPTFHHYAMPKFENILKGFHQLIAFFNNSDYANSIGMTSIWGHTKMDWLHSGPQGSRRFANGGRVTGAGPITVADNPEHDEYVINPYNSNALPLMKQAWRTIELNRPELRSDEQGGQFNGQVVTLLREAVNAIKNIDLQPEVNVDEMTSKVNKKNAQNWRMA